jgi:hypothetical protein
MDYWYVIHISYHKLPSDKYLQVMCSSVVTTRFMTSAGMLLGLPRLHEGLFLRNLVL